MFDKVLLKEARTLIIKLIKGNSPVHTTAKSSKNIPRHKTLSLCLRLENVVESKNTVFHSCPRPL
jgi:hypothetical protein